MEATKSPLEGTGTSASIDPDQLLATCHRIRDSIDKLDKSLRSARLRLITLMHVGPSLELSSRKNLSEEPTISLKCFDDLLELSSLSEQLVAQLDELLQKLEACTSNSINYQIAHQQLMFFTSEWYDHLTPEFNETLELAERVDSCLRHLHSAGSIESTAKLQSLDSAELRLRGSLLNLKQSMSENERLIGAISSNIESTRKTIESIYASLDTTKFGLDAGERNLLDSHQLVSDSQRCRRITCIATVVVVVIMGLLIYML